MKSQLTAVVCVLLLTGGSGQKVSSPTRGSEPALKVSPGRLEFGLQPVGTASQPGAVAVLNITAVEVKLRDLLPSGIDFTQTNSCPQTLAPGGSCVVSIVFKPVVSGNRMGALIISPSGHDPVFVGLSGTGQ